MKRFALLAVAVLAVAFVPCARAQISVKEHISSKTLKSIRLGYVKVTQTTDGDVSVFSLVLRSTNDYEGPLIVHLGKNAKQAAETMNGIVSLFDVIDKGVTSFTTPDKKEHSVTRGMSGNMYFLPDHKAGDFIMGKGEAKKCAEALEKAAQEQK